jgi:hypothetical protein
MKRYIALLLGLGVLGFLIFGCDTIIEPEQTVLETGKAETVTDGEVNKKWMVPFRGRNATWESVAFAPIPEDGLIQITGAIEGTATPLGRFQGVDLILFEWSGDPYDPETWVIGDYVSNTSTYTAANGDELYAESGEDGYYDFDPDNQDAPWDWHGSGLRIVGGTGRFENAEGWYDLWGTGTLDMDPPHGTADVEGEIYFGKMAPFRGSGTYYYAAPPNIEEDEVEIVVALEGTVTRLGHFQGVETYRFSFDPDGSMGMLGDYLSHSSIYTAANGDELHIEGCVVEHCTVHDWYEPPVHGFSLTGVHLVGGTGRFANAVGGYDFSVNKNAPDDPGGTWEIEGGISIARPWLDTLRPGR